MQFNKLKSTFLRNHTTRHSDDRRSQQFAKKLNAAQFQSYDVQAANGPPTVQLDELSEMERAAYQSWWKDLDPFSIGHLDNEAVLKFLRGCCLPDHKLEQILRFFEDTVDGLDELQFYAMLRLIAHAQNGRTISRDMVFLGAPVPRFQTNAIDALIKPAMNDLATPQMEPATASKSGARSTSAWPTATQTTRNSWIQLDTNDTRPAGQRPTSWYVGQQPIQTPNFDTTPSAPFLSPPPQSANHHHSESSSSSTGENNQFAYQQPPEQSAQYPWGQLPSQSAMQATMATRSEQKHIYTHSRSRSVPYSVPQPPFQTEPESSRGEDVFVFDTVAATPTKQQQRPAQLTSRVSMDADSFQKLSSAIDTGQSLLLTKKFVPPKASNNPFESAIDESPKKEPASLKYSPFADEQQTSEVAMTAFPDTPPRQASSPQASAPPWPSRINNHPNKQNLYPPPVPSQATKPAFLKYARNDVPPSYLRRTRSYGTRDRAPSDPFNNDTNTTFTFNSNDTSFAGDSSPFYSTDHQHNASKLFRHKSDGSSLMRR